MPKYKKPVKNAFMFFMQERRGQLEREGHRFPRGFADVANYVQGEWSDLTPDQREKYERLAKEFKEKEKTNLDNKFTATGESFSSVQRRMKADADERLELSTLFRKIVLGPHPRPEERIYITMKATAACEVGLPQGKGADKEFYPLELAVAAFSLKDGFICSYWTLVDTISVPCGYASAAKETSDETSLPQPGGKYFQTEYLQGRDYDTIINKIRRFIQTWGAEYPDGKIMIFGMDADLPIIKGCLDWLVKHSQGDKWVNQEFFEQLKYYQLPELVIELSVVAATLDRTYINEIVQFQLPGTAETLLKYGNYDYKEEITCQYHKKDDKSQKMHLCCQNIILRRIFLMLEQLTPAFKCDITDRHRINVFFKATLPAHLKIKMEQIREEESHASSSCSSSTSGYPSNRSSGYPSSTSLMGTRRDSSSWADDTSDTVSSTSESAWLHVGAKRARSPYDEDYVETVERNFSVPWGAKKEETSPTLLSDDFPPLGAPSRPQGRGRGIRPTTTTTQSSLGKQDDDDDAILQLRSPSPPLAASQPPMGRGVHRGPAYGSWN